MKNFKYLYIKLYNIFKMRFKIFLATIAILLSFCQPQSNEVLNEDNRNPLISFNCNNIESNNPYVLLNVSIVSFNEKLFNISIKGQGTARDYYRQISDIEVNSNYESEFVFNPVESGTYSFQLYVETLSDIQIKECTNNLSINIITTTRPTTTTTTTRPTTTRPTTTTTTTRPTTTTTTTTMPSPDPGELLLNTSYVENLPGCKENRSSFKVDLNNNSNFTLEVEFWTSQNNSNSELKKTLNISPGTTGSFNNSFENDNVWFYWKYRVRIEGKKWSDFVMSNGHSICWDIILNDFSYDEELYIKRFFIGRDDNPFICEYPGKGYRVNKRYGRCISWIQWYEFSNMEKGDSNWIQYCWNEESNTYTEPGRYVCDY